MFDKNDDAASTPKQIVVDLKRLRMRDFAKLEKSQENTDFATMVPIFARVCNQTEDEVWDWDIETMFAVQQQVSNAMDDVLKKTRGAS